MTTRSRVVSLFPSHRKTGVSGHPPPIIPAVVKTDLNSALPLESNGVCLPIGNANGGPPVMKPQSWVVLISLRLHRLAWLPSPSATTYTSSLAVYRPLQPPSLSLSTVLPCFAISNALHPLCSLTICTAQLSYIQLNQHTSSLYIPYPLPSSRYQRRSALHTALLHITRISRR
jgi:hypothetical protein